MTKTRTEALFQHLPLPENFRQNDYRYAPDLAEIFSESKPALYIVDMQRYYCDPKLRGNQNTEAIVEPIRDLKRQFNDRGLPVFVIYMDHGRYGIHKANGGLYGIEFNPETDIAIAKDADSAFMASRWCADMHISDVIDEVAIDTAFTVGVHFSQCVESTARDSAKKLKTFVVGDCTANGQVRAAVSASYTVETLAAINVNFVHTQQVSQALAQELVAA